MTELQHFLNYFYWPDCRSTSNFSLDINRFSRFNCEPQAVWPELTKFQHLSRLSRSLAKLVEGLSWIWYKLLHTLAQSDNWANWVKYWTNNLAIWSHCLHASQTIAPLIRTRALVLWLCSRSRRFESKHRILDGHFSYLL